MEKTEKQTPPVICDAGSLIHLDELGCLDLLADFNRIIVPGSVWSEVAHHRPSVFSQPEISLSSLTATQPVSPKLSALTQIVTLHAGEWEALRLSLEFPNAILLTDDTAARLAAANLGIAARGTIGILLRAIRRRQRTSAEVLDILKSLPDRSTLHLKRSLLDSVIGQVREAKI